MDTRDIVYVALFAAVVGALGVFPPLTLPLLGVPITAQTLGVMLAGSILGARRGALALLLFLVLVAAGVPILAGGRGGFGVLLGPSGGFLLSWPMAAFAIGWMVERVWGRLNFVKAVTINVIGGILLIYVCGIPWLALVAQVPWDKAFFGSLNFIPGDLIKAGIAAYVAVTVKRAYPLIQPAAVNQE